MKHPPLTETTRNGRGAKLRRLTGAQCPQMTLSGLRHIGTGQTGADFCMVRTRLPGPFLIGTIAGSGWVRTDGRWTRCEPGMMCLSPARVLQGCHGEMGRPWRFVWCRWDSATAPGALARPDTPLLRKFPASTLASIVSALCDEAESQAHATVIHHLLEALNNTVLNFTGAFRADDRLARLWQRVEKHPGDKWSVERLAGEAACSREHLRRLCQENLGRTPQEQLAWIRLRHAASLITSTAEKLESIAGDCGYSSAFALSNAFMRWMGCRPSDLRSR